MRCEFEVAPDLIVTVGNTLNVQHQVGEYVALDIREGMPPVEGKRDERTLTSLLLKKNDARSIASAIMGAAAGI